jgi:hypothetical protein
MLAAPPFPSWFQRRDRVNCVRFVRVDKAWAILVASSLKIKLNPRSRVSYMRFLRPENAYAILIVPLSMMWLL